MSRETVFRTFSVLLALFGVWILWNSTIWGLEAVSGVILHFGSISGDGQLLVANEGPVAALRTIGAILLGIGLFRALEPSEGK